MKRIRFAILIGGVALGTACRQDMHNQPKYKPLAASSFFADGRASRPTPAGTIAIDELDQTDTFHTGSVNGAFAETIPAAITSELLHRGEQRFNIFCSPCHGRLGNGDGMVARRGFRAPPDLNSERVRQEPPGYIFQVVSNGYGAMPDYRDQVPTADRWAIVAYLRALQLSRSATLSDVPASQRGQLEGQP